MSRLGLTRVAFACQSPGDILEHQARFLSGEGEGRHMPLTSRRVPRRDLSGGALFWIIRHQLVARQDILGVDDLSGPEGPLARLRLAPAPVLVEPRHCRAHQGWRYLAEADWPPLAGEGEPLPPAVQAALALL
jgi:hypothetical protein